MKRLASAAPIVALAAVLMACGGAPAPGTADPPVPSAPWSQPPSLPPSYGHPLPPPPAEGCNGCRYRRVVVESKTGQDRVLLCAHEPTSPIKPIDQQGTSFREAVAACDDRCCPSP